MARTILAIFHTRQNAEDAIGALEDNGYNPKDISIMMRDTGEAETLGHDTGANVAGGAATGATTGAVVGGIAGLLIGIGAIAIPGVGAFLIGGPIAAALGLTGAAASTVSGAATGALAGGILGALVGLGVPEEEARMYESAIREGAILLAVPVTEDREHEVRDLLREFDADQLTSVTMADDTWAPRTRYAAHDDAVVDEDLEEPVTRTFAPHHAYVGAKGGRRKRGWFGEPEEHSRAARGRRTRRSR